MSGPTILESDRDSFFAGWLDGNGSAAYPTQLICSASSVPAGDTISDLSRPAKNLRSIMTPGVSRHICFRSTASARLLFFRTGLSAS